MSAYRLINDEELQEWLKIHNDWSFVNGKIVSEYKFKDLLKGSAFASSIKILCTKHNHHAKVESFQGLVRLSMHTHDAGGKITNMDLKLAEEISVFNQTMPTPSLRDILELSKKGNDTEHSAKKQKIRDREQQTGKKIIRFDPDYTCCLWDELDGGGLSHHEFPLSGALKEKIDEFIEHYCTIANWKNPPAPSEKEWDENDWTWHQTQREEIFNLLKSELKDGYEIIEKRIE